MATEIKRNSWSRFCKNFNLTNQYRPAVVRVRRPRGQEVTSDGDFLFMGVTLTKSGRLIDGLELYAAQFDPERLSEPIVSVKQPVRIVLEKDTENRDSALSIKGEDGTEVNVALTGERTSEQFRSYVEKVAYAISERKGFAPGSDVNDWLEAERKVKETELQFV